MSNGYKRIAFLVSGGGTNMQAVIDAIKRNEIKGVPALVIAGNDRCYAVERAGKENIPVFICALKDYASAEARDAALLALLKEHKADLVLLAGFLGIVGPKTTEAYAGRMMNIHPSLLPAFGGKGFYGLRVHEAALKRGVKVSGATVHFVDGEIDGGMIIAQKAVPVMEDDTPESLQKRVSEEAEHIIFPEAVRLFCEDRLAVSGGRVTVLAGGKF